MPRAAAHLPACAELALATHLADRYPVVLPEDIGQFLDPGAQLLAWVGVADDAVVGHVALHRPTSTPVIDLLAAARLDSLPVGVVSRLMVAPRARGQGLGTALLDTASRAAHARGLQPVLDVVTTYGSAIRLYERAGWEQIGVVSVAMPDGQPIDEYVFVGPSPTRGRFRTAWREASGRSGRRS